MIDKTAVLKKLSKYERKIHSLEEYPGFARAGVLILLFPKNDGLRVILTVRTNSVETHKGQISLPGGMADPQDEDIVSTALRETEEELGISRNAVEILGLIDDRQTPSKFIVTPVVGYANAMPEIKPNSSEVAQVFDAPLSLFADLAHARSEERTINFADGKTWTGKIWYFDYEGRTIWGATAFILMNLVEIVLGK
jgi:8-oxo-dGTP pyrophosphatase MutT (NUDIX family)